MTYRQALVWLFGTQRFGIKLGLENIQRLLGALHLPAPTQRILHVAGTNGKGSVCAMLDAICRAQGYRTGLFTSPHLVSFRERMQVNGVLISEQEVAHGLTSVRDLVRDWEPHPTFFEIATALGLWHFQQKHCEIVVLETGMGGRLDSTNAVTPVVSVITPIDFDHQKWLGHTLTEIAGEKAGIIKPGVPVVCAPQPAEAEAVVRRVAAERAAPLQMVHESYEQSPVALAGAHQKENAAVACAALRAAPIAVREEAIRAGLAGVTWPARFQHWSERLVIDGAHNPAGARILARTWREHFGEARATILLAILQDKDAAGIVRELLPIAARFLATPARSERALAPEDLAAIIRPLAPVQVAASLPAALAAAEGRALLTGSLHFAGEALAFLRGTPDELEDCLQ